MTNEMIQKAKECQTAEELLALAKENGFEITAEEAAAKFALLNNYGELSDEELENTAGGGCHGYGGKLVVTLGHTCDLWRCKDCGGTAPKSAILVYLVGPGDCSCARFYDCNHCKYLSYEKGLWLCNHEENMA